MTVRQIKAAYEELSKHVSPWARVRTIECSPEDTATMLAAMAENAATGDRGLCGVAIRQSRVLPVGSLAFLDFRGRLVGTMTGDLVRWEPVGPRATFRESDQPSPIDAPGEARSFTEDQVEYLITRGRR